MNFQIIETARLILKGLSPADVTTLFENYPKAEIMRVLGHRSEEDYLAEEHKQKNGYSTYNRSFLLFLISDKSTGQVIGRCSLHNWNKEQTRAEIGYVMHDETQRQKGFMTEAVTAVIAHGFNELKLRRIEALTGVTNTASLRLLEKSGFQKEGLLREHWQLPNGTEDSLLFSLLRREYVDRAV